MLHGVTDSLQDRLVPVEDLHAHPRNPRKGNIEVVAESLSRYGQLKPIVVQKGGPIVAGHHVWKAAQSLGWTHVAAIFVELEEREALRYLLMDNRASDLGEYDFELGEILQELYDEGGLEGTGFTPDDVEDLLVEFGKIEETAFEEFEGGYAEDPETTQGRYDPNRRPGGVHLVHREFVLAYQVDRYEEFVEHVKTLKRVWGIGSARDAIFEAVRRKAADPDEPYDEEGLAELLYERQQTGLEPREPEEAA